MVLDVIIDPAIETAAVILSPIIEALIEITIGAKNVFIEKKSFAELAKYLERIVSLLKEFMHKEIEVTSLNNVVEILRHEVKMAKELVEECGQKNRVYLLVNCRSIAKRLERITREISRALSLIPLSSLDLSLNRIAEIKGLMDSMRDTEIKAAIVEEEILQKIELGIHERNFDSSYVNNLLLKIADTVGISKEPSSLRKEFEECKKEIEIVRLKKDHAEAIHMDQIIAFLERADVTSSPNEREIKYQTKRDSLGIQPLEPLRSFYCPITEDVMLDPVETSLGHTFERSAIEKWYAEGNNLCPLTSTPVDTSIIRPNKTLRQSIEEWKDRNTMIKLASMKSKLSSQGEEVASCLDELQKICNRDIHQEWVLLENYIPILIGLLTDKSQSREIRHQALVILCILAKNNDDAKERIAEVNNAIESIVLFLGRSIRDAKVAVELLLELSKNELILVQIGKAQGCILLLVTLSSNNDSQASEDARKLLHKLSFSDQNIILMARSNYFEPLLLCLSSGPEVVRQTMVMTLAEMELTEFNRSSLFGRGVLTSLLNLILQDNSAMKKAAAKAIQNLSSLPRNGLQMIQEGVVRPLLDLLFLPSSPLELREDVATTIVNLARATELSDTNDTEVTLLESDEDLYRLFSMVNTRAPSIQQSVLQAFQAMCCSPSASTIKNKLAQCMPELLPLCENDNRMVRASAIKLLSCLTDNNKVNALEHMDENSIKTILTIISSSDDEEEIVSAMGIISNLPERPHIAECMVNLGTLSRIVKYLSDGNRHNGNHKEQLKENAVGALRHFSNSTNQPLQKIAAETGVIRLLVKLLESGTDLTKERAASCLAGFSRNSTAVSKHVHNSNGFARLFCCSSPPEQGCPVHRGICTEEESFCLVKTGAVGPLARVMEGRNLGASEAALDALLTLIEGEKLQNGCKILAEANAIRPIIDLLGRNSSVLQEKVLISLERIFRLIEFKQRYGGPAQTLLVDLTQRGDNNTRPLAAKILAHLGVIHQQSSYF
ncbi:U-box domain-containing protein 44-like [Impatiens glandulifera]|uniref:U-box domain-containing protein 44-like n=1 Tax=Impatiens glandulifera TaxID=253017 RepID=UPI001FB147F8|nr:U-box domain-containing protein 44-like [Impatiens glandulifera]XP_047315664.1 U-box domain-containing protein 44-like [Impatiens glandulifera]